MQMWRSWHLRKEIFQLPVWVFFPHADHTCNHVMKWFHIHTHTYFLWCWKIFHNFVITTHTLIFRRFSSSSQYVCACAVRLCQNIPSNSFFNSAFTQKLWHMLIFTCHITLFIFFIMLKKRSDVNNHSTKFCMLFIFSSSSSPASSLPLCCSDCSEVNLKVNVL
jgi:hypothetical protein